MLEKKRGQGALYRQMGAAQDRAAPAAKAGGTLGKRARLAQTPKGFGAKKGK